MKDGLRERLQKLYQLTAKRSNHDTAMIVADVVALVALITALTARRAPQRDLDVAIAQSVATATHVVFIVVEAVIVAVGALVSAVIIVAFVALHPVATLVITVTISVVDVVSVVLRASHWTLDVDEPAIKAVVCSDACKSSGAGKYRRRGRERRT